MSLDASAAARLLSVIRLLEPDDLTPPGARILRAIITDEQEPED